MDGTECNLGKFQVGNHGRAETFVGSFLASDRDITGVDTFFALSNLLKIWGCACAGYGSGARIAAGVGTRCRGNIAGFVFISYPLTVCLAIFCTVYLRSPPLLKKGSVWKVGQEITHTLSEADVLQGWE